VPLKKYPEIVFDASKLDGNDSTNTYVQAGYTVTASSTYSTYSGWKVFDGVSNVDTKSWYSGDNLYSGGTPIREVQRVSVGSSKLDMSVTFDVWVAYLGEWVQTGFPFPVKIKASWTPLFHRDSSYGAFDSPNHRPRNFTSLEVMMEPAWSSALSALSLTGTYTASWFVYRAIDIDSHNITSMTSIMPS
jgi:hypothetical protein